MKMMVKLAVLMAALLLSGVAFAFCPPQDGSCYRVTATDLDNPENSCTRDVLILFNYENNCGYFFAPPQTDPDYPPIFMFLGTFFDAMNKKATGGLLLFDSISLKFHGDRYHVVTGELFSACFPFSMFCGGEDDEGIRCGGQEDGERYHYSLRGIKQEECAQQANIVGLENLINQTETMFMDTVQALSNKLKTQ